MNKEPAPDDLIKVEDYPYLPMSVHVYVADPSDNTPKKLVVEGYAKRDGRIEVEQPIFDKLVSLETLIREVAEERVRITIEVLYEDD